MQYIDHDKLKIGRAIRELYFTRATADLAKSIEAHGIITPLIVSADYTIIDGVRRFQVANNLNIQQIPCIVVGVTAYKMLLLKLALNKDNLQSHEARALVTEIIKYEPHATASQLATIIGVREDWLTTLLMYQTLPWEVQTHTMSATRVIRLTDSSLPADQLITLSEIEDDVEFFRRVFWAERGIKG